jgi:hypothetical protein
MSMLRVRGAAPVQRHATSCYGVQIIENCIFAYDYYSIIVIVATLAFSFTNCWLSSSCSAYQAIPVIGREGP